MKKFFFILWMFITFFFYNCNCEQPKQNLFEDFYENIPQDITKCSKDSNFHLEYHTKKTENLSYYAKMFGIEEECIATGKNIKITYWKNKSLSSIQIVELSGKTPMHSLGNYIGFNREKLLKTFPEISFEGAESSAITCTSENWEYFITFILEKDIVTSITLGKNL